jgi:hypothetical protein
MAYFNRPIRRSQLLSPWGIGAIIPFPKDESLMIAGLDYWYYDENNISNWLIEDTRLKSRLGVEQLRLPPDYNDETRLTIPAVRFPLWHYCPFCGAMTKSPQFLNSRDKCDAYQWPTGRKCSNEKKYRRALIPERFIVICEDGHIDDFPLMEWVHRKGHQITSSCRLRRSTGGVSTSLAGVRYTCTCGASESLLGATRPGALDDIYKCQGLKPWLGYKNDICGKSVKVVQRGGSNVWFADIMSSISIPVEDNSSDRRVLKVLDEYYDKLINSRTNGSFNREFIDLIADFKKVNSDDLFQALLSRANGEEETQEKVPRGMDEEAFRLEEYLKLITNYGNEKLDLHTESIQIKNYDESIQGFFDSITLVKKLRETRVFHGFSRVHPNSIIGFDERKNMLSNNHVKWLPAIVVYGEGIFFKFNKDKLLQWRKQEVVIDRMRYLDTNFKKLNRKLNLDMIDINPIFVLLHTFAHVLINQLSFDCGYGSSALRERIYCDKGDLENDMFGVLIYTASGDSEGSLGGLVKQGVPKRIEDTINKAIENARWCTSDPICIASKGQGPDSCNLAACHNCALLPETSCENSNRLLDRALLVGTLENDCIGYFND